MPAGTTHDDTEKKSVGTGRGEQRDQPLAIDAFDFFAFLHSIQCSMIKQENTTLNTKFLCSHVRVQMPAGTTHDDTEKKSVGTGEQSDRPLDLAIDAFDFASLTADIAASVLEFIPIRQVEHAFGDGDGIRRNPKGSSYHSLSFIFMGALSRSLSLSLSHS